MARLTQCLFDLEFVQGEDYSFSSEYVVDGKATKLTLFSPWFVVQLTTRWGDK